MKEDGFIVSGFSSGAAAEAPFAVDFSRAKKLDRTGSTCDAYECTIQHRRVFVKRLKTEYRNNPLYRAAFSKEYDLGVTLSHPSLPRYVGFGKDYLVLDFVEGDTLADLIKRGDERLKDRKFVKKLLGELVDVVEYLHNRNIVHCDIKADNIIVSPYADRPVTLIDLDKARSPWLDSTHGDTAKYGCEGCADGTIDFKAIGLLAEKLGFKKLDGNYASAAALRRSLRDNAQAVWRMIIATAVILTVVGAFVLLNSKTSGNEDAATVEESENVETLNESVRESEPEAAPMPPEALQQPALDTAWIAAKIAEKEAEIRTYGQTLLATLGCDTIPVADKHSAIMDYIYQSGVATNQIIFSAVEKYRNISELEVQMAVRNHPAWVRLMADKETVDERINAWNAKESRRSSALPVSLPDTTQDADLHAPHR